MLTMLTYDGAWGMVNALRDWDMLHSDVTGYTYKVPSPLTNEVRFIFLERVRRSSPMAAHELKIDLLTGAGIQEILSKVVEFLNSEASGDMRADMIKAGLLVGDDKFPNVAEETNAV